MMFEKIKRYFRRDLWDCSLKDQTGWRLFYLKMMRIVTLSVRGFVRDQCTLVASALTYYTLMSLVPILALFFAVSSGFGYQENFKRILLERFEDQQVIFHQLFSFSDRLLEETKGGILAIAGLLVLFWSVALLLSNIERAFNQIWNIKKLRQWRRIFSDYFSLMLIGPLFFILSNSLAFLSPLIPYVLLCFLFTFVYYFFPNTKVRARSALTGGVFTASVYLLLQWGYLHFQTGLTRYSTVYGSFAALPLFLIWVQLSWFLLLFGAEMSFATQTHKQREYESLSEGMSYTFRQLLILWIAQLSVERLMKGKSPISVELLMQEYRIPYTISTLLLRELVDSGILIELKEENTYLPNKDVHALRIADVIEAIECKGSNDWPLPESGVIQEIEKALLVFRKTVEDSPNNRYLKDL